MNELKSMSQIRTLAISIIFLFAFPNCSAPTQQPIHRLSEYSVDANEEPQAAEPTQTGGTTGSPTTGGTKKPPKSGGNTGAPPARGGTGGNGTTTNPPPAPVSCAVTNGAGQKNKQGQCIVQSCKSGYKEENNKCVFITVEKACSIPHGSGVTIDQGSGFGPCKPESCDSGYGFRGGECQSNKRTCDVNRGQGLEFFENGAWSECKVQSCANGHKNWNNICVKNNAPTADVNFFILRKDNGSGNELWSAEFVEQMVKDLTDLTEGNVKFVIASRKYIKNTDSYNLKTLEEAGGKYLHLKKFTEITVLIANPGTTDAWGKAMNVNYNYEPYFTMRARSDIPSDRSKARNAAAIFLHELGHNMDMEHDYEDAVHMDNHYYEQPWILADYIRGLNSCTSAQCQNENEK